jgi:hypothetical protein
MMPLKDMRMENISLPPPLYFRGFLIVFGKKKILGGPNNLFWGWAPMKIFLKIFGKGGAFSRGFLKKGGRKNFGQGVKKGKKGFL